MTSLPDALRRELHLARFSWAVQDHPDASRLTRELRREITATATAVGIRQTLADLGRPGTLAEAYVAELGRPAPRWRTGVLWSGFAFALLLYTQLAYGIGTLDALADLGGTTLHRTMLGSQITFWVDDSGMGATMTFGGGWLALHLAAVVVPLLLGARVWRWRPHQRTRLSPA